MNGIVFVIMPTVEMVVDDDHRTIVITQRTPAEIIGPVIPVHPGRPPSPGRNPIPAQAKPPVPSAVMGYTPSPRLIRAPRPPADRVPNPSSIIIGPPRVVVNIRDPDITVRSFILPPAVIIQFGLVFVHFNREVSCFHIPVVKDIPPPVPFCESILASGINILGTKGENSVGRHQSFSAADYLKASFASGLDGSFHHKKGCFFVISDLKTIESFLQNIKGSIRAVELELFFYAHGTHTQIDISGEEVQADRVVSSSRQLDKINLCVFIDAEIIFPAEMDFGPAILSSQLVTLDNRQIDRSFLITHILGSLNKNIPLHII
jgi:hypothetical protein